MSQLIKIIEFYYYKEFIDRGSDVRTEKLFSLKEEVEMARIS